MPTGPIGAEAIIPMIIPLRINSNKSIFIGSGIIQGAKLLDLFDNLERMPRFLASLRRKCMSVRQIKTIQ